MKVVTFLLFLSVMTLNAAQEIPKPAIKEAPAKNHLFKAPEAYNIARQVQYIYHLKNEKAKLQKNVSFSIYAP